MSGPFSFLDSSCTTGASCLSVSVLPDWLQATAMFGLAIAGFLVLFILLKIVQFLNDLTGYKAGNSGILFGWLICLAGPPLAGVVFSVMSMAYGVQNGSLGFVLGGVGSVVVIVIYCLLLLNWASHK